MRPYRDFSAEELALDESFQTWVLHASPEAEEFWNDWLRQNPDRVETVGSARRLLGSLKLRPLMDLTDEQASDDIRKITEKAHSVLPETESASTLWLRPAWRIAAALLLALAVVWIIKIRTGQRQADRGDLVASVPAAKVTRFENLSASDLSLTLPDQSTVVLSPGASLRYLFNDKSERVCELNGTALFKVTRNPKQPFLVFAGGLVTRVLGTSFRVSSGTPATPASVTVLSGKVSVYPGASDKAVADNRQVILTPNQRVDFLATNGTFRKYVVNEPLKVKSIPESGFEFRNAPVADIFALIEQAYGIEIVYDKNTLKNCALTASLSDESMKEKIQLICDGIHGSFEEKEGRIFIQSKGCQIQ